MNWTGHPYIDVGLATILAFCDKNQPAQLEDADLARVADWISVNYVRDPLRSFLTVAFTTNSWFFQSSYSDEKRTEMARKHVYAWRDPVLDNSDERCVFFGSSVTSNTLAETLQPGRAARAQIPLIQGNSDINFGVNGTPAVPVSGEALLCLQAFPLGCAKIAGRLLLVHASDPELTRWFARGFLSQNLKGVQLAQEAGSSKLPESSAALGTTLIEGLMSIWRDRGVDPDTPCSITAYHLTNGQTAEIALYHLPLGVTRFLARANSARYARAWQSLVHLNWAQDKPKGGGASRKPKEAVVPMAAKPDKPRRNHLFEALLTARDNPAAVLRRYFVGIRMRRALDTGVGGTQYWELTQLFLQELMNMDQTRIEYIRKLGDSLATYVVQENDKRFLRDVYSTRHYAALRSRLLKASLEWIRRGHAPLVGFAQFVEVFEEGDEVARKDWGLARDMVLFRMIEQLHESKWLSGNSDALPEPTDDATTEENTQEN
jgi:CRISPR-associated protein Cst1